MIPEIFQSGTAAILYGVVYFGWIAAFFVERLIIRTAGQSSAERRSDKGSAILFIFSIFASITIANAFAGARVALLPAPFFYLGIVMMIAGIVIRLWAVTTLRHFFTYTVQIKQDHRVVENGPYRFARHPAYTGSLLTILGVGFALQSWGAALLMTAIFGITIWYRIRIEERALISSLGDQYAAYSKRVKRLLPYIL